MTLQRIAELTGYPVAYFLDPEFQHPEFQHQRVFQPKTRLDFDLVYPGEPERARAHFEIDQAFRRIRVDGHGGG